MLQVKGTDMRVNSSIILRCFCPVYSGKTNESVRAKVIYIYLIKTRH